MNNHLEIVLIEDNVSDAELIIRALRKHGFASEILHLKDGEAALEFLDVLRKGDRDEFPRLILLDINMPKVNGLQVLEKIKMDPKISHIPVVLLTSSREVQDLRTGYRLGANSFVVKPVEFDQFMNTVSEIGAYWLELNQIPG